MKTVLQLLLALVGSVMTIGGGLLAYSGLAWPRHDVGAIVGPLMVLTGVVVAGVGFVMALAGFRWLAGPSKPGQ